MNSNKNVSAKEMFRKLNLAKDMTKKLIKYGKISKDIAYELMEDKKTKVYTLSFVTLKDNKLIYSVKDCVNGSLNEMLQYIADCKKSKIILNNK